MSDDAEPAGPTLRRGARTVAGALIVLALYAALARTGFDVADTFFRLQDRYLVAVFALVLLGWSVWRRPGFGGALGWRPDRRAVIVAALVGAACLWAGTYLLMADYPLTRDEHMVVFDMGVFRSGRLAMPLAPEWRPFASALVPNFLLPVPGHAGLISNYLPANAALRAGFARLADPALMNPALAGVGLVALFSSARRLFPGDGEAQAVVLILYATSAQVLVAAMTDYAMTAHLALNLVWLALFLRGGRSGHAAALAVGFVATGLHQLIFHPLFVLPFLPWLAKRDQRRTALFYVVGYLAIVLFWASYPRIVLALGHFSPNGAPGIASGPLGFVTDRVVPLLLQRDRATLPIMALNLLRFATWQNLALLPLALLAVPLARAGEGIARPLYYGILLTVVAMAVMLPYQGHGWGYRYLHPLIGSFALLAGYGWRAGGERAQARSLLRVGTVVTLLGALPFLLATTRGFVAPYARVDEAIGRVRSDLIVVDTQPVAFAIDSVRNPADLSARPIRLASGALVLADMPVLCRRGSIAMVSRRAMQALGLGIGQSVASPGFDALRRAAPAGCRIAAVTLR